MSRLYEREVANATGQAVDDMWAKWLEGTSMSKPTREQLEKVWEKALELTRTCVVSSTRYVEVPASRFGALSDAVRAAEQPRWAVMSEREKFGPFSGFFAVVRDGREWACYAGADWAGRIARLLNEDEKRHES